MSAQPGAKGVVDALASLDAEGRPAEVRREAIRALFLSVLMEGGRRGWWNYDPGATNREHLAAIREPVERRVAMRSLVSIHERTWYGMGPAGEKDYRASEEWVRRMGAVP